MFATRKLLLWTGGLVAVFAVALLGVGAYVVARSPDRGSKKGVETAERADAREAKEGETSVVAVKPRRDPKLKMSVQQLLSVEPFFVADLRAQVAGVVRYVQKDIGDRVKKGEVLVAIDVPDVEQNLREKEAAVAERRQAMEVARAQADDAAEMVEINKVVIDQRKAELGQAEAKQDYHKYRYERFAKLEKRDELQELLVKEEYKEYLGAQFAVKGAEAAVRKAVADLHEKESALAIAEADIKLKENLIGVAEKARDRAHAMLDYAQITAPFDGVVVKRKVDVGTFVQNASTGQSEPIMTVARDDIVTLVMKVPDNAARYVTRDTEAVIQIDELPDVVIRGKVTRFSPWIQNQDRTMRVEVDLYNDTPARYQRFQARALAARAAGMAADSPLSAATFLSASRAVNNFDRKSERDPLPQPPVVKGRETAPKLISGMTGYMRLNLESFDNAFLVPSSVVFTRGGKPYIMEVKNGATHLLPVRVQLNDGRLAKVKVITKEASPINDQPEESVDLTGDEVLLLNRQSEVADGQLVKVTMQSW
jgi:multidrug resistance efflux pump